jgi:Tfp pilus assembly protein PilV
LLNRRRGLISRRGLTLIEAIAAIVVVGVPPVMMAVREAAVRRVDSVQAGRARWLAGEKLEDVIADRQSATRGYAYVVAGNYPAEPGVAGFTGFARSVAIAETGASLVGVGTGYKRVTVTVTWTDHRGQTRSLALATVVTDYQ